MSLAATPKADTLVGGVAAAGVMGEEEEPAQ